MIPFALKCELVAQEERLELIRAVIITCGTAVKFVHGATPCPVCALAGKRSVIISRSTDGEIRYCMCHCCGATIKAVGEIGKPAPDIMPDVKTTEPLAKAENKCNNKDRRSKKHRKRG